MSARPMLPEELEYRDTGCDLSPVTDPRSSNACFWCGRLTTSGVCLGPHEDYNHHMAKARGDVSGAIAVQNTTLWRMWRCDVCGRHLLAGGETAHKAMHRRQAA